MIDPFADDDFPPYEEESLFARDQNHQLIRVDPPTREMYDREVRMTIDGLEVLTPEAIPTTDSQGNIVRDVDGRTIPRSCTINDAANQLVREKKLHRNPIPILCHQDHMRPVGMCRVCCVQVFRATPGGQREPESKLLPACQYPVRDGMEVHTIESKDVDATKSLRTSIKMLVELLATDHLHSGAPTSLPAEQDELRQLADRLGVRSGRLPTRPREPSRIDQSSDLIAVDLNSCILCNRCVRGCDEVKDNHVISRTGKGYRTKISFDLDVPMGKSSCIGCGECMISCPTGALTLKTSPIQASMPPGAEPVSPEELRDHPLFAGIPFKFLQWNSYGVVRRRVPARQTLYKAGEDGNTAFVYDHKSPYLFATESDENAGGVLEKGRKTSLVSRLLGHVSLVLRRGGLEASPDSIGTRSLGRRGDGSLSIRSDGFAATASLTGNGLFQQRTKDTDPIMGEMTCLFSYPRATTVKALTDSVVLEIRRNVLRMMLRNPNTRVVLDETFRKHALDPYLRSMPLFEMLGEKYQRTTFDFLKHKLVFRRVEPGQIIYRQGDLSDALCFVRLGYVKVAQRFHQQEVVQDYVGPGGTFGEVGLLASFSEKVANELPEGFQRGRLPSSYSALDYVELVTIRHDHFRELCRQNKGLLDRLEEIGIELLKRMRNNLVPLAEPNSELLSDYLEDGLFKGQSLLVLDLERCTRCDECTRACSDSHGGVTRLIREGERHGRFLVATSCRSCVNPTCMLGCPVDAIHRTTGKHITIESWCIGCGLCSQTCPYGVINVIEAPRVNESNQPVRDQQGRIEIRRVATACDLCESVAPGQPNCVYACPHDAAFRMKGGELSKAVHREPGTLSK
jgi:Fe-S-cluster-containing hydrogenase component 2/CRP-like cAMP-binding protein